MITSQQMRELEEYALSKDISIAELMENAGKGVFRAIREKYELTNQRVAVFCGTGNNGGDGLVVARYFHEKKFPVIVLLLGLKDSLSDESLENYDKLKKQVNILCLSTKEELSKFHFQRHHQLLLIDAMLGIGVKGIVREPIASAIDLFNSVSGIKVAVDLPSGLNADTGEIMGKMCECDFIVTFHELKAGLEKFQEKVRIVDIGIPKG
ncbi:NAD(P)H-hydrate epimerase [Candidatus Woesearchaeota archaeon]|nr:NAD(P)H-hydrate epimerase [Candidatus Woesearchaeota archaeon]